VAKSVNEFIGVLIEAIVIVLLVSFVALGLHKRPGTQAWSRQYYVDVRPGLVVAITIPLVLSVTFLGMYYWGIGLHKISLGSLIIALGLLVDDAIIAVEMMVRKIEEGYDKVRAATFAYEITAMPMLTGTLITAVGFLPIGIARSTVGEYTFAIFGVTVLALLVSWLVSVYFVPYLGTVLLKAKSNTAESQGHEVFDTPFYNAFRRMVNWCVAHRWTTIAVMLLTFALGIFGMGRVQQQFFPDSSRPEVMMDVWFAEGTSIAANEEVSRRIEARLMQESGVVNVATWIGSGVPRFYLPLDAIFQQSNVSQFIVLPVDLKRRESLRIQLSALMAQEFPEVRARVKILPNGPPVAYPVQFRVIGPDADQLRQRANEVKAQMRANPNMRGVNDNWNEPVKVIRLDVDQAKARALGVSSQSIAQAARTLLSGSTVGQFRDGDKLIDIVLRQPLSERNAISDIGNA
jgi:multidrug efflux pump subunit AcrB